MVGPIVLCMSPVESVNDKETTSPAQFNNPLSLIMILVVISIIIWIGQGDIHFIDAHTLIAPIFIPEHIAYYRNLTHADGLKNLRYRFKGKALVYGILCRTTQMIYVGSTFSPEYRFHQHLISGETSNNSLQEDLAKYGLHSFTIFVFTTVKFPPNSSYALRKQILVNVEQSYINMIPSNRLYNMKNAKV
jgi:hypothetical protein